MKKFFASLLIILVLVTLSISQRCSNTNGEGPQPVKPCVFPFRYKDKEYNECTAESDPDGKKWCSTEVDSNGLHKRNQWGYCDPNCEQLTGESNGVRQEESAAPRCDKTISMASKKTESCIFPFKFKVGNTIRTFDACTNVTDTEGKFWCSTKVDAEGFHQTGNWGYCNSNCNPKTVPRTEATSFSSTTIATAFSTSTTTTPAPAPSFFQTAGEETIDNSIDVNYDSSRLPEEDSDEDLFCGSDRSEGFIVGGENAKQGAYPFIAALGVENKNNPGSIIYVCGGSLINRRYVLTAAHCQSAKDPIVAVRLGEHDFARDPDCAEAGCKSTLQQFSIRPEDVIVHEKFDIKKFDEGNDIALIRLPRLANTVEEDSNSRVMPICLAWKDTIPLPTTNIHFVVGWGRNSTNKFDRGSIYDVGAATAILQQLQVPLVPFEECIAKFKNTKISDENHICAGAEKGKDSCSGDSGGPLVVKTSTESRTLTMYLEGIVSFGSESCNGGIPGIYTRVSTFIPWILANLKP